MRGFIRFFLSSAAGLLVDLALFAVLYMVGLEPGWANAVSAAMSVSVVYLLVTRYTFPQRMRWWTYAVFIGWYLTSIALVSVAIQWLATATAIDAAWWKLCSIPLSFLANFAFSRLLFTPLIARDAPAADEDAHD